VKHKGEPRLSLLIINYTPRWVLELSCVLWQHICVLENTGVLEIREKNKSHLSVLLLPFLLRLPDVDQPALALPPPP